MTTEKDGAGEQDKTQEELYNEAWNEAEVGEGKPDDKKPDNPEPELSAKPEDAAKPEGAQDGLPEKKTVEPEPQTPPKNPEHGNLQSVEKALKDTKAYATKLAQDKAALEKELTELKAGRGSAEAVNKAKDDLDATVEELYQDYPELKKVLDPVVSMTKKLTTEMESLKKATEVSQKEREEREKREETKREFETAIKPEIVKAIPDFDKFMAEHANDLMTWGEAQTEAIKTALFSSKSPRDIVWAITEYKKSLDSGDAEKAKAEQQKKAEAIKNASATLRGGGSKPPFQRQEKSSADDWEEAGKLLEKQGIK
jgi:chromosome segregation ATPase